MGMDQVSEVYISNLYQECRDRINIVIGTITALSVIEPHKDLDEISRLLVQGAELISGRDLAAREKERQEYQKQSEQRGKQWRD